MIQAPAPAVLIVVDMQNDFLPGGALAVPGSGEIITTINVLATRFAHVVLTQDWHPPGHISFASSHPGRAPLDRVALDDGREQVLWPDHCLQGSRGAAISDALTLDKAELVIRKGYRAGLDSYSAFLEADRTTHTGLAGYLRERRLTEVVVAGLATDFCAGWTAIDAANAGFATTLVLGATRAIDMDGSMHRAMADMRTAGVTLVRSAELG